MPDLHGDTVIPVEYRYIPGSSIYLQSVLVSRDGGSVPIILSENKIQKLQENRVWKLVWSLLLRQHITAQNS